MGQLSVEAVEAGVELVTSAALEGRLDELLGDGPVRTSPDERGVVAQLGKTGSREDSWRLGMMLSWRQNDAFVWAVHVSPQREGGATFRFWPRDRAKRLAWKKENPESAKVRVLRTLVLPEHVSGRLALHDLLTLQTVLHAVQERLVDLAEDSGADALFKRFERVAKKLLGVAKLDVTRATAVHEAFTSLYRSGPRRAFLGADLAGSFADYLKIRLRFAVLEARGIEEGGQVPSGLREAGRRLGVSKDTIARDLERLGAEELDGESWRLIQERRREKDAWRELQARLETELGITPSAARKRVYRYRDRGLSIQEAKSQVFGESRAETAEEGWGIIREVLMDVGYSVEEAERAVDDLRAEGLEVGAAAQRLRETMPLDEMEEGRGPREFRLNS